jgi:hypothetical protein
MMREIDVLKKTATIIKPEANIYYDSRKVNNAA